MHIDGEVIIEATSREARGIAAELGARQWARTRVPHAVLLETDGLRSVLMTFGVPPEDLEDLLKSLTLGADEHPAADVPMDAPGKQAN